jgi:hypothetical protein
MTSCDKTFVLSQESVSASVQVYCAHSINGALHANVLFICMNNIGQKQQAYMRCSGCLKNPVTDIAFLQNAAT